MGNLDDIQPLHRLLAHPRFRKIFAELDSPKTLKQIVKEMHVTKSTAYYVLRELGKEAVVKYDQEMKVWYRTAYGEISLSQLEELAKHAPVEYKDIFSELNLGFVPLQFRYIVKFLHDKCHLIKGNWRVYDRAQQMLQSRCKTIRVVLDSTAGDILSHIVIQKIRKGVKYSQIAKFVEPPKNRRDIMAVGGNLRRAHDGDVFIGILIIDDKQVAFVFPKDVDILNWDFGFYSDHKDVLKWANDVFRYISRRSKRLTKNQRV